MPAGNTLSFARNSSLHPEALLLQPAGIVLSDTSINFSEQEGFGRRGTEALDIEGATPSNGGIHYYTLAFSLENDPTSYPVGGVDANEMPIRAVPFHHLWDYRRGTPTGGSKRDAPEWITFACEGFALAECVDFGYSPWTAENGVPLAAHHQACTCMIRGDYCGDGKSFGYDDVAAHHRSLTSESANSTRE